MVPSCPPSSHPGPSAGQSRQPVARGWAPRSFRQIRVRVAITGTTPPSRPRRCSSTGLRRAVTTGTSFTTPEQAGSSAFRGTTKLVTFPGGGGAAAWADEGGFVYEITCVPSWDVNKHIQGRRMVSDLAVGKQRWGGNLVLGEHEHCIPARVPAEHIKRYGAVVTSASGVPFVPRNAWVANPRWNPCFCRYSLSDCEDTPCH